MSFKNNFLRDADAPDAPKSYGYNEEESYVEAPAETPEVAVEPAVVEAPVKEEAPTPVVPVEAPSYDWKKELKSVDKKDIFKELGLDDFTIGMLEYKEKAGDLSPYLEVKSVDYVKMSAEDVLKMDMRKANPGMSEKALNFKFNKELSEKYYLDRDTYPDDSEEAEYGVEQLRLDSENKRKELIAQQQAFRAPEPQPDIATSQREAAEQVVKDDRGKAVLANEHTVALTQSKSIQFGDGEESFTYPITDADDIVDKAMFSLMNSDTALKDVNLKEFYQILAIGKDVKGFLAAYGGHQKALEHKRVQGELQNITPKNTGTAATPPPTRNYGYNER